MRAAVQNSTAGALQTYEPRHSGGRIAVLN